MSIFHPKKTATQISVRHVIAEDGQLIGDFEGEGGIQIDGKIKGKIKALGDKGAILIGPKGFVEGPIEAKTIVIAGRVKGNITASHLTVKGTGIIDGDIQVNSVQMELGSHIKGATLCGMESLDFSHQKSKDSKNDPFSLLDHSNQEHKTQDTAQMARARLQEDKMLNSKEIKQ